MRRPASHRLAPPSLSPLSLYPTSPFVVSRSLPLALLLGSEGPTMVRVAPQSFSRPSLGSSRRIPSTPYSGALRCDASHTLSQKRSFPRIESPCPSKSRLSPLSLLSRLAPLRYALSRTTSVAAPSFASLCYAPDSTAYAFQGPASRRLSVFLQEALIPPHCLPLPGLAILRHLQASPATHTLYLLSNSPHSFTQGFNRAMDAGSRNSNTVWHLGGETGDRKISSPTGVVGLYCGAELSTSPRIVSPKPVADSSPKKLGWRRAAPRFGRLRSGEGYYFHIGTV